MRLKYQLFLILLLTGGVLITLMAAINSWSFDRGFIGYINETEQQRLDPLIAALASGYSREGSWKWIPEDKRAWRDLLAEHFDSSRGRRPTGARRDKPRRNDFSNSGSASKRSVEVAAPPGSTEQEGNPITLDPRLLLADADRKLLIGRVRDNSQVVWLAIDNGESTVGYLGYRKRGALSDQLDQAFATQQRRSFKYAAIAMALASALIALLLANRLARPLLAVNEAVSRIGRGQYDHRVPDGRKDELGDLSRNINTLAMTLEKNQGARRQWIAEISHELRTPLAILQGEIEAIQDGVIQANDAAISSLHSETLRLSRLVNDFHDLTMSDIGALNYRFEPLDIAKLVFERARAMRHDLDVASLNIEILTSTGATKDTSDKTPIMINGDAQRLGQLVDNLLQNSCRYTHAEGSIQIQISCSGNRVMIDWSDSSPGVDDEQLDKLFDPLFRADESRHRDTGGSGLGLAIAKQIVEAHQGTIDAQHAAIGGLRIKINLPLLLESTA